MLILQRRAGESIRIGDDIEITIVSTEGGRVRIAISAPSEVPILRSELVVARETNLDAAKEQIAPDKLLNMLDGLIPTAPQTTQPSSPVKLLTQKELKQADQ